MTNTEYHIAHMKLQELRRQRSRFFQAYEDLELQVQQSQGKTQQLQTLFTGLQNIKLLEIALHPDVANMEPLLNDPQLSDDTISFWHAQLTQELSQGRLRSELIYIFGALQEEWLQEKSQRMAPDPASSKAAEHFLALANHPLKNELDHSLLDTLFADRNFMGKDVATWFQQLAENIFSRRISSAEVDTALEHFQDSYESTSSIRGQAKSFAQNSVLCKDMAEALSILLTHLEEWEWSEESVRSFSRWSMSKWRLFISYDLFTMCFLEILGTRLQTVFYNFGERECGERGRQLNELVKEPSIDDEEVQIEQVLHLYRLANSDIWKNLLSYLDTPLTRKQLKDHCNENYSSITYERKTRRKKLRESSVMLSGYTKLSETNGMGLALQFMNAEIELTRAAFPDTPLYVLKVDLRDFYPTLPHELVLTLLERYGFSQRHLAFFRTFLEVRIQHEEEPTSFRSGVPLNHRLSYALGEMVLQLLDQHILRSARVQIIRMVDDICILTCDGEQVVQAWQAVQEFCQGTGLTINQEKCGAVCIQGELPSQLPTSLPGWLFMQLNASGAWQVDMEAFTKYHQQAREQVLHCSSLLSQIEVYNQHVKHLMSATAMEIDLGKEHRRSVGQVFALFHQDFFQPGYGMLEALHTKIQEHFTGQDRVVTLPEAWFYWPITAGGCGLTQAMILAAGYAETHRAVQKSVVPEKRPLTWQSEYSDWLSFYSSFIWNVHLKEPEETKRMEMLVNDFIQRSNEIGNIYQTTLGPYWRWIVYIYGPQILQHLGSFRFLITELVPLQLILQHYKPTAVLDNESTAVSMDTPF